MYVCYEIPSADQYNIMCVGSLAPSTYTWVPNYSTIPTTAMTLGPSPHYYYLYSNVVCVPRRWLQAAAGRPCADSLLK
jgi:hypothetical protein